MSVMALEPHLRGAKLYLEMRKHDLFSSAELKIQPGLGWLPLPRWQEGDLSVSASHVANLAVDVHY